jgi:hypothetical protein
MKCGDTSFSENISRTMPMTGIEPAPCCQEQILSLPRLPIPPHRPKRRIHFATKKSFSSKKESVEPNFFDFQGFYF